MFSTCEEVFEQNHGHKVIQKLHYAASKIDIRYIIIFHSKHITKGAIKMTFSPGVGKIPNNPST